MLAEFISRASNGFSVLVGADSLASAGLAIGGCGLTIGSASIAPELCVEMFQAMKSGNHCRAFEVQKRLDHAIRAMQQGTFPASIKSLADPAGMRAVVVQASAPGFNTKEVTSVLRVMNKFAPCRPGEGFVAAGRASVSPEGFTNGFGVHIADVEVDPHLEVTRAEPLHDQVGVGAPHVPENVGALVLHLLARQRHRRQLAVDHDGPGVGAGQDDLVLPPVAHHVEPVGMPAPVIARRVGCPHRGGGPFTGGHVDLPGHGEVGRGGGIADLALLPQPHQADAAQNLPLTGPGDRPAEVETPGPVAEQPVVGEKG